MTFEGKAKRFWSETSYIELIELALYPKNRNHLRSNSRAIRALDRSRLDLEYKSGRIFCFRQVHFTKSCQQIWGWVNQPFLLFMHYKAMRQYYLSYRPWTECSVSHFFTTNCTQVIFRTINRGLLAKTFKKCPKSPIRPAGSHFWRAPNS